MSKERIRLQSDVGFKRALQTTNNGRSGRIDDFNVFQNVETDLGGAQARKGLVRLARIANSTGIMDADGTNDRVDFPAHASLVSLGTVFTLEILFQTDDIASTRCVLGPASGTACGVKIQHTSTSTVTVLVTDSAANTTTLTFTGIAAATVCALQLVRDGASLTAWLNGTTATGTMNATNALASGAYSAFTSNGSNWMDGGIDNLRIWKIARATHADAYCRLLNPRNQKVMFCWVFNDSTAHDVLDQGPYGAHATTAGSPTWARSPIALNPAPVQALGHSERKNGRRDLVAMVRGSMYAAEIQS